MDCELNQFIKNYHVSVCESDVHLLNKAVVAQL